METYNATNSLASDPNRGNQLKPQNYQTDVLSLLKDLLPLVIRPHLLVPRDITSPLTQGNFHTIQISIRVCWTSAKTFTLSCLVPLRRKKRNCFPGTVALPWKITGHRKGRLGGRGPGLAESEGKAKSTFEKCTNFALLRPENISPLPSLFGGLCPQLINRSCGRINTYFHGRMRQNRPRSTRLPSQRPFARNYHRVLHIISVKRPVRQRVCVRDRAWLTLRASPLSLSRLFTSGSSNDKSGGTVPSFEGLKLSQKY